MANSDGSNLIFFSKNNYILGDKLRKTLRKINAEIKYSNDLNILISNLINQKNNVVFIDKVYKKYAKFISQIMMSQLEFVENVRFVFIDDDLGFYLNIADNNRVFVIPEKTIESSIFNIITKCQLLNLSQDSADIYTNNYGEIISTELCNLGFSYKLAGFRYIKQCLEYAIKNNFILGPLSKDIYPHIGMQNSTGPKNIERSIRTSILDAAKHEEFNLQVKYSNNMQTIGNRYFLEYMLDKLSTYKNKQFI